jgi:threonylcarbamoyladenosine tRNA methylthiotransferase MtaB
MKVSFYNLGCKVNLADISRIGKQFEDKGHDIVDFENESDIVLINTCTVTHRADADCKKIVRRALRQSPNAYVGVVGCFAQLSPDEIIKIDGVDGIFGQKEKFNIPELIGDFKKQDKPMVLVGDLEDIPFHTSAVSDNTGKTRAVFKIQDGCEYNCTFCTIPMARGGFRSIDFAEIETEIENFHKSGFGEVILSGINLGEYKSKSGEAFTDVVRHLDNLNYPIRYRISSIEPNLLKSEILDIVQNSNKFTPHFHIPLQSGSQDILMKMKRRYRIKNYKKLILDIKERMPDTCIGADLITGFPGETDEHFRETFDLIQSLSISYLHVFTYSERSGTVAASLEKPVPHEIRKERTKSLRELSDKKLEEFYRSQIGKIKTVIPESYARESGMWRGWTENYVSTIFYANENIGHELVQVKLLEYKNGKVFSEIINTK